MTIKRDEEMEAAAIYPKAPRQIAAQLFSEWQINFPIASGTQTSADNYQGMFAVFIFVILIK